MADVSRLPAARAQDWDWQAQAACRGYDSSVFFHPDRERGPARVRRDQAAKQVCSGCPVREECLEWALKTREPYGVWGGMSTEERDQLIRLQSQPGQPMSA